MKSLIKLFLGVFIFFVGTTLFAFNVSAANIYIEPSTLQVSKLEEFKLDIRIDIEEEDINALEFNVVFDKEKLAVVDVLDGESIVSVWVERIIDKNGQITLSGLIPGGYSGLINPETGKKEDGLITSLVFRPQLEGLVSIEIKKPQVFANDGEATSIETDVFGASVNILDSTNYKKFNFSDDAPPKVIESRIYRDSSTGDYFLAFYAEDKESGISHFEVKIGQGDWVSAENPYHLGKKPYEDLFIKAIDRAGNVDIVEVSKGNLLLPSERAIVSITLLLMMVLVLVLVSRTKKRHSGHKQ